MQLRKRRPSLFHISRLREQLAITDGPACLLLLIIYLAFASVMVLAIAKVGSNINYLIEFVCVIAIFAGLACKDAADALIKKTRFNGAESFMLCVAVPAVVGAHALMMPARHDPRLERPPVGEMRQLVETVRQADRPVISDDMVLLKRAGKPVVWEPAIFAELASKGMWDSRPFIEMIRCQRFAFFVTQGVRGDALFNQRYDGAVADAMDRAYPIRRDMAGLVLHLPRGRACLVIKSTPRERT